MRFRPPPIHSTPGLCWLLRAAFATPEPGLPPDTADPELAGLAERLSLAGRIWVRTRPTLEAEEDMTPFAAALRGAHARAVATSVLFAEIAGQIVSTANEISISPIFLKGYALLASGKMPPGRRPFSDLDLLVAPDQARPLHRRLRERGFLALARSGNEQHLASLRAPSGGTVDIHFCLHGLVFQGRRWASADDLAARGLLRPLDAHAGRCWVPAPGLMAAHLLTHGLAQHFWLPGQYPLLRLLGDLIDLLPDEGAWDALLGRFGPVLTRSIAESELLSARRLAGELRRGRLPNLTEDTHDAALLLRHMLAGTLDPGYARSLKPRYTLHRLLGAARHGRLFAYLGRKLGRLKAALARAVV